MKKRFITAVVALLLTASLAVGASANSGPTQWPAAPGLELAVDAGCPVTVGHEDLTFDFSDGDYDDGWSPTADVTASYTMTNPTDEPVSVTMAFPFFCSLADRKTAVSSVTAGGGEVPFDIYFGNSVESSEYPALELGDILSNVRTACPSEPADGVMYTITPIFPDGNDWPESIYAELHLRSELPCYLGMFSGYSLEEDGSSIIGMRFRSSGTQPDGKSFRLFVSGGVLADYDIAAYEDYSADTALENIEFNVNVETLSFRSFIELALGEYSAYYADGPGFDDGSYWALLSEMEAGTFDGYLNYLPVFDVWNSVTWDNRLAMAVYSVDFLPLETKNVKVSCGLQGWMERPSGYSELGATYTYTYLSNPAKNWADFGTLSIKVIQAEGTELTLSSSVPELTQTGEKEYGAELTGLPDKNFTFVLSRGGVPPNIERNPDTLVWILTAAGIAAAAAAIILLAPKKHGK